MAGRIRGEGPPGTGPQKWLIGGAQVLARRGQLTLRPLTPVPALARGLPLHPDDPADPYVFRIDLSSLGLGTSRVVFTRSPHAGVTALHLDLDVALLSFDKRPADTMPSRRRHDLPPQGRIGDHRR